MISLKIMNWLEWDSYDFEMKNKIRQFSNILIVYHQDIDEYECIKNRHGEKGFFSESELKEFLLQTLSLIKGEL